MDKNVERKEFRTELRILALTMLSALAIALAVVLDLSAGPIANLVQVEACTAFV